MLWGSYFSNSMLNFFVMLLDTRVDTPFVKNVINSVPWQLLFVWKRAGVECEVRGSITPVTPHK